MSVQVVNSGPGVIKVSVETTPAITVTSPEVSPVEVTAGLQGETGPQGATGPQGPAGADGADGQGVPAGGDQFQLLRKISGTDYDTEWDYADRVTLEVRFDEAVSKGDPLYITGFNNGQNRITVAKADASDSSKMPSIGLAFADYSQNDNGQATAIGSLDDVNTQVSPNDFQEGDVVYVKAGGGLTNVKPTGTNLIQNVGKVGRRQQNNGEIVVMAIGRSNDIPNIQEGYIWAGNSSGVATATDTAYIDIANSRVGIGTTSPTEKLHIAGKIRLNDGSDNVLIGTSWGSLTTASKTVAVGYTALSSLTTGGNNTAVGADALFTNATGNYNTALGFAAARQGSRSNDVSLGYRAGIYGIGTSGNVSIGFRAGEHVSDIDNVLIGNQAGFGASDSNFDQTVAVGAFALQQLTTGADNVAVGHQAGTALTTGGSNVLIGYKAGSTLTTESNKLYIENSSSTTPLIYGDFGSSTRRVGIEESSPMSTLHVKDEASIGRNGVDTGRLILRSSGGPTIEFTGTGVVDTTTGGTSAGIRFEDTSGYTGKQRYVAFASGTAGLINIERSNHATNIGGLKVQQQNSLGTNGNEIFVTAETTSSIIQSRGFGSTGLGQDIVFKIGGNSSNSNDTETEVVRITDAAATSPYSVGIGTNAPGEKLHVVGQIKVDDGSNPYTFPAADGSANQVLQTDGSGAVTFASISELTGNELENVVEDLTPQLGGDLDVNGKKIVSASNGDIVIEPNGTGAIIMKSDDIQFDGGGVFAGKIKLYESDVLGSNFIAISAPLGVTSDTTLTLPDGAGSSDQALKTNGSGTLSWGDVLDGENETLTGITNIKDVGVTRGRIAFYDDAGDNFVAIKAADTLSSDTTFTLPESDGSAGQTLQTDGSGALSFSSERFYDETTGSNQFKGDIVEFGSGPSGVDGDIVQGKLYYLGPNQYWEEADADAAATASGMIGIAVADDTPRFLIRGFARASTFSGFTTGNVLYVKTTAGGISETVPSGNGDIVRVVGYVTNASTREIFFDPDKTFVEV
jgi:co-chaperonin GroES (HSP10)